MNKNDLKTKCLQAGLPVDDVWVDEFGNTQTSFTRSLTSEEWQAFCDLRDEATYVEKRAREYPPLEEFADAFYWLQKGNPALMNAYIAKCDAVKASHPKP